VHPPHLAGREVLSHADSLGDPSLQVKNATSEQFGPPGTQRFQNLFTSTRVGKLNMADFFRDMSHGKLDLSGSQAGASRWCA
jgi:hypothetical protein